MIHSKSILAATALAQGPYIRSTAVDLYYHQQYDLPFGVGQSGTRVGYNSEFDVFSASQVGLN